MKAITIKLLIKKAIHYELLFYGISLVLIIFRLMEALHLNRIVRKALTSP